MTLDPREIHLLEQFTGTSREISSILAGYKKSLIENGFSETEAWVLVQRMEERLMGPLLTNAEQVLKEIGEERK